MKRLLSLVMTIALSAAACGGVKNGSADAGPPDGDHRTDGGGPPEDGGTNVDGPDSCVLGTSELGNCSL